MRRRSFYSIPTGEPNYTKGALLYGANPVCALCETDQPRHTNVWAVFRRYAPNKGLHPLRRIAAIPAYLGNKRSFPSLIFPYRDRLKLQAVFSISKQGDFYNESACKAQSRTIQNRTTNCPGAAQTPAASQPETVL